MKFKSDLFILSVQAKESKKQEPYVVLNVASVDNGETFQIISKSNIDELLKLQPFTKYSAELNLSSSKYGIRLEIVGATQI